MIEIEGLTKRFGAVSAVASAIYGLWLTRKPVSGWRTLAKTAPVGALAVLALRLPKGFSVAEDAATGNIS